jgi:uncharacterized protein YegL
MRLQLTKFARPFALVVVSLFLVSAFAPLASANHTDTSPVRIDAMDIQVSIDHHYAVTTVAETVTNPTTEAAEFTATVASTELSYVTRFALEVGGHTYEARVEESAQARADYSAAVAGGSAGAIIESRDTHTYEVSMNVPAATTVVVHLAYEQLVYRTAGAYTYRFPLVASTASHSVGILTLGGFVEGSAPINAASSTHGYIDWPSSTKITFSHLSSHLVPAGDFILTWTEATSPGAGTFIAHATAEGGTFLHVFSPDGAGLGSAPLPKDIVFVIDVSGSMTDSLPQVKQVFSSIIGDLSSSDRLSVVAFAGETWQWSTSLSFATPDIVGSARAWVENLSPQSSTDIDAGLSAGMAMLALSPGRAPTLVLLTDGEPTSGITDAGQIRANLAAHNGAAASVYTLAFGSEADFDLLQAIALENGGSVRRIWIDKEAGDQIRGFYDSIATPLLTGVTVDYSDGVTSASPLYYARAFAGSDLVTGGTLAPGTTEVTATVTGRGANGPVTFTSTYAIETAEAGAFVERAAALEKVRALSGPASVGDLGARSQIVALALTYTFVTDYTSLVVVLPASLDPTHTSHSVPFLPSAATAGAHTPAQPASPYSATPSSSKSAPGPDATLAALGLAGVALVARARRPKKGSRA